MSVSPLKYCVVVTNFHENQPGFLDFAYRIKTLSQYYQLTIISHQPITQAELLFANTNYVILKQTQGKVGLLYYCLQSARYIRKTKPSVAVLMHSSLSLITLMLPMAPCALYWNEHPSNLMRLPERFSPLKYLLTVIMHKVLFFGAKRADLVMPIGEEHYGDLIAHGSNSGRVVMIYMGVDDAFFEKKSTKSQHIQLPLKLIYIGTVSQQRGRDVMLEAMVDLAEEGIPVHLTIVGADDIELTYCKARIQQLGINTHVEVLGRVTGDQIPKMLANADIGICLWEDKPWWRFNPPTKLFEYLTAGLPVLASDIRTHTRYIQNWRNGLVFEYSAEGLTSAIGELVLNKSRLSTMKLEATVDGEQYLWSKIEPHFLNKVANLVQK